MTIAARLIRGDPLDPHMSAQLAATLLQAGRSGEALHYVRDAIEVDAGYWEAQRTLGDFYVATGQLEQAVGAYERALELAGETSVVARSYLARTLARAEREDEAGLMLEDLREVAARSGRYAPVVATVLLALHDADGALEWLEQAYRQRDPSLRFIRDRDAYALLWDDPRFIDLLRRIGLPH